MICNDERSGMLSENVAVNRLMVCSVAPVSGATSSMKPQEARLTNRPLCSSKAR